jgi:ATPase subunit of ABC transporter with duplicated ATPase domains
MKIQYGDKVCLMGDNGCGKSTFIKRILDNSDNRIRMGTNIKVGYIPQQINFEKDYTVLEFARKFFIGEESHLRSALDKFYFHGESVFKKVSKLSGGEKVRLKLFALIQDNCNFIILDEPTNHIDIFTKETLENALIEYKGTLLFVSHDRYFINKIANKIFHIHNKKIKEYVGNYDYYVEHKKEE